MARVVLLDDGPLAPGTSGWVQLRLEAPVVARAGDRAVVRSYSPVTTIAGAEIAEASPPKRNRVEADVRADLATILDGTPDEGLSAALRIAGWAGVAVEELPLRVVATRDDVTRAFSPGAGSLVSAGRAFAAEIAEEAARLIMADVAAFHADAPWEPAAPLARVRSAVPRWADHNLANAVLARLVGQGRLELVEGGVRSPDHVPRLTADQERAIEGLAALYSDAGLAPPTVEELPAPWRDRSDRWVILRQLEARGTLRAVADGMYFHSGALDDAVARVRAELGGRTDLGPADFREALPVTRKHLIPLLNHFDGLGVTVRRQGGRDVPGMDPPA